VTARLIVLTGQDIGKEITLQGTATLGRLQDCTLMLIGNAVSREHAKVFEKDGRFFVVDLNSSNGTRVNGNKITRHELADGDEIQLGDQRVRFKLGAARDVVPDEILFDAPEQVAPVPDAAVPTVSLRGPAAPPAPPGPAPELDMPDVELRPRAEAKPHAMSAGAAAVGPATVKRKDRILQYHKIENKKGLLSEDIGQRGIWFRLAVGLFVLALSAGIVWGIQHLMSGTPADEPSAPGDNEGR
jgi:pSer/pThr/pTyr-binding forkhead associated (FHA) protein